MGMETLKRHGKYTVSKAEKSTRPGELDFAANDEKNTTMCLP